jgi:transposase InsO family protein
MSRKILYLKKALVPYYQHAKERARARQAKADQSRLIRQKSQQARSFKAADPKPKKSLIIDHTKLDVFVEGHDGNRDLRHNPWVTVIIDKPSREIVKHLVTAESPSFKQLLALIRKHVRAGKRANPEISVPETFLVDNGLNYRSHTFADLISQSGIQISYPSPKQSDFKSQVERFFSPLNRNLIKKLKGRRSHKKAQPSVETDTQPLTTLAKIKREIGKLVSKHNSDCK